MVDTGEKEREVFDSDVTPFSRSIDAQHFETSSKTGKGVLHVTYLNILIAG